MVFRQHEVDPRLFAYFGLTRLFPASVGAKAAGIGAPVDGVVDNRRIYQRRAEKSPKTIRRRETTWKNANS